MAKKNSTLDLTHKKFGRLTIIGRDYENEKQGRHWLCQCDCGRKKSIITSALINKRTQSCGCLHKENIRLAKTKHGYSNRKKKHLLYEVWKSLKQRCYNLKNKSHPNYGRRGITVCERWLNSPKIFIEDCISLGWKLGLQIDRIDNNKGYSPANCRFVTNKENQRNTRTNRIIEWHGKKMPLSVFVEQYSKVCYNTFYYRINHGWSLEAACR